MFTVIAIPNIVSSSSDCIISGNASEAVAKISRKLFRGVLKTYCMKV